MSYVIYHNGDERGALVDPLRFFTSRSVTRLPGHVVWAIEGTTSRREKVYRLRSRFTVTHAGPAQTEGFTHAFSGQGAVFSPGLRLNDLPWFPGFLKSVANFSLGLTAIPDERCIEGFERLVADGGDPGEGNSASNIAARAGIPRRALSIRQPYAEMILRGVKTSESRSQPTKVRGPFSIYAAKSPGVLERFDEIGEKPGSLPTGVIVGTARIVGCRQGETEWEWLLEDPERLATPIKPERHPQPKWFWAFEE